MSQEDKEALHDRRLEAAKSILEADPGISYDVLAKRIAMKTQHAISASTAHGLVAELQGRRPKSKTASAIQKAAEANKQ